MWVVLRGFNANSNAMFCNLLATPSLGGETNLFNEVNCLRAVIHIEDEQ